MKQLYWILSIILFEKKIYKNTIYKYYYQIITIMIIISHAKYKKIIKIFAPWEFY